MKMKFRKNWWIWLIVGVLCCAMLGGIIYAIVTATENKEKTVEISASEFSLGGLDDNGKYVETKESIYTKDAFQCQGLTVTPEFESQVTYQIYFYDSLGEFLEKTASLEKVYRDDIPLFATHARIVITPNEDEDGNAVTMNVFNKSKYAKQLTIEVDEKQSGLPKTYNYDLSTAETVFALANSTSCKFVDTSTSEDNKIESYVICVEDIVRYYNTVTLYSSSWTSSSYSFMEIVFLKSQPVVGQTLSYAEGFTTNVKVENSIGELSIPSDCTYIVITGNCPSAGVDRTPDSIVFSKS